MSKYIDGNNPVDIAKVEEHYASKLEEAEKKAKKHADGVLERIRHFKEKSYAELIEEKTKELNEELQKEKEEYLEDPNGERFIWIIKGKLKEKLTDEEKEKKSYKQINEIIESEIRALSSEEKQRIVFEYLDNEYKEIEKEDQETILRDDILYDLMTEDQVEKYITLFYTSILKNELIGARMEAVREARDELGKKSALLPQEKYKDEIYENSRMHVVDDDIRKNVTKIKNVEDMERMQESKADSIKNNIQLALECLPGVSLLGTVSGLIGYLTSNGNPTAGVITGTLTTAIILALCGVDNLKEIIHTPRAIDEAKKLGLYDLLVEYKIAAKEDDNYYDSLRTAYNVEDKAKAFEEAKGGMAI